MPPRTASIIGSGPNGLAAAITLAQAGVRVAVYEARETLGGACSSGELTLPGFHHDLGASALPMAVASPFLRTLPLAQYGLRWVQPDLPFAHPLDHGQCAALPRSLDALEPFLGARDAAVWRRLFVGPVRDWDALAPQLLGPVLRLPSHPLALARFGLPGLLPAATLARTIFRDEPARALFAGCAVHAVRPLTAPLTSAVGMVLAAAGHAVGWPVAERGSQSLSDALAQHLQSLGGVIRLGHPIRSLGDLQPADVTLFDTSPETLLRVAGDRFSAGYRAALSRFTHGPGVFKLDWALSAPIPWAAEPCRRAGTVHVGGTLDEITAAEQSVFDGRHTENPFVLLVQPSVCDPTRAPAGSHTAWAYVHVPNGSTVDRTQSIEAQVERFAPGFRDCILARAAHTTAQLEAWNPNLVGGDLSGGAMTARQIVLRPNLREYGTSDPTIFLCSSSTPPGGGVHGMCGHHAAHAALRIQS